MEKKKTEEMVSQLQMLEQNLQQQLMQKQQFQTQLLEIESAISELSKTKKAYKIVGNIMVEGNKDDLSKSLLSKKEMLDLRIRSVEKQEDALRKKAEKLREEVMKVMK